MSRSFAEAVRDLDGAPREGRELGRWLASALWGIALGMKSDGLHVAADLMLATGAVAVRDLASGAWRVDAEAQAKPRTAACPACSGFGERGCGACDGHGLGALVDDECTACGGTGSVACEKCDGSGEKDVSAHVVDALVCLGCDERLATSERPELIRAWIDEHASCAP